MRERVRKIERGKVCGLLKKGEESSSRVMSVCERVRERRFVLYWKREKKVVRERE